MAPAPSRKMRAAMYGCGRLVRMAPHAKTKDRGIPRSWRAELPRCAVAEQAGKIARERYHMPVSPAGSRPAVWDRVVRGRLDAA